jgi:hypothetical protein
MLFVLEVATFVVLPSISYKLLELFHRLDLIETPVSHVFPGDKAVYVTVVYSQITGFGVSVTVVLDILTEREIESVTVYVSVRYIISTSA